MTKIIEAEVVETELLEPSDLIEVTQVPQVKFNQLKEFSQQVKQRLDDLQIDKIKATEDNLKMLTATRTVLNKEFKELEESRKKTEQLILAPYKEFESEYNILIKDQYKDVIGKFKTKIDKVTEDLRKEKSRDLEKMFNELVKKENIDFVKFSDVGLNVQRSTSMNKLENELKEFIDKVVSDIKVIETYEHKERVLVSYQKDLDLSRAIVEVNESVKKEQEYIAEQKKYLEEVEKKQKELEAVDLTYKPKEKAEPVKEIVVDQLLELTFTVIGTKEQLVDLREYMKDRAIRYE